MTTEPIKDAEWSGTFTIHDPADLLFTSYTDTGERQLIVYADKPMIFFRRWFYDFMVTWFGWKYPQVVVWSGEVGRTTKLETTELEDGSHRIEWSADISKIDIPDV